MERYPAKAANDTVVDVLNGLTFSQPSTTIYTELVRRLLSGDDASRRNKARKLRDSISRQEQRIGRLQDNLADGIITSEDFTDMKTRFSDMKVKAVNELNSLEGDTKEKTVMLKMALTVISGMGDFYSKADSKAKIRLLGSIFPEMIEFDGKKCRTTKINQAVALCLSIDKRLSQKENRILPEKLEVSGWVVPAGIEPATHGFSVRCSTN